MTITNTGLVPGCHATFISGKELEVARYAIQQLFRKSKKIQTVTGSSDELRHICEDFTGREISRGAVIAAFLKEGYAILPVIPNAYFNVKFSRAGKYYRKHC